MRNSRLVRVGRHLLMTPWRLRRDFSRATLEAIDGEIRNSEAAQTGEICFVVEGALHGAALYRGQSARDRALELFSGLRLWDTDHRNSVLIYVLLADRAVEIIADRGAHAKVDTQEWAGVCRAMEAAFSEGRYRTGAVNGIRAVTRHLSRHFPVRAPSPQEHSLGAR